MATRAQIKAYFQTGDTPTQAQFEEFFDSIPFLDSPKKYTALISQTGTATPTAVVLENTLGFTPTLARNALGVYHILFDSPVEKDKLFIVGHNSGYGPNPTALPLTNYASITGYMVVYGKPNFDIEDEDWIEGIVIEIYDTAFSNPLEMSAIIADFGIEFRIYP